MSVRSSNFAPVIHGLPDDRPDEADTVRNAEAVANALATLGYQTNVIPVDLDLTDFERLAGLKPLVVFNLVESIRGDGRLGHLAAAMMEHFAIPFTGAGAAAYYQTTSKILTKILLQAADLPAPAWWRKSAPKGKKVIIKSVWEHASYGMDQNSVVDGEATANEIAAREKEFGGRFFAEKYIHGREFNVSILELDDGPMVLPIPEMRFDSKAQDMLPIVDYAAKWDVTSEAFTSTQRRFGLEEHETRLAEKLKSLALKCWAAAEVSGYSRVDFRVDTMGRAYILEINANPCLAPDAGFAAALKEAGFDYEDGIEAIVKAGRRARRR